MHEERPASPASVKEINPIVESQFVGCSKLTDRKLKFYLINFVTLFLLLGSALSFITEDRYNFFPVNGILELTFILLILLGLNDQSRINKKNIIGFLISFAYIAISALFFIARDEKGGWLNFIYTYKSFYYIALLSLTNNHKYINQTLFKNAFTLILFLFLMKYLFSRLLGVDNRPGVFIENNFEIMSLLLFYSFLIGFDNNIGKKTHLLLFVIVVLSGSRSGIVTFIVCYIINQASFNRKIIFHFFLVVLGLVCSYFLFKARLAGNELTEIDRLKFLHVFIYEIKSFSTYNILFGADIISELSHYSCSLLSFYQQLFYQESCYSVVMHGFVLRTLHDHGLVFSSIIVILYFNILRNNGMKKKYILTVFAIAFLNGLSVSSMNSIYFALPILITFGITRDTQQSE